MTTKTPEGKIPEIDGCNLSISSKDYGGLTEHGKTSKIYKKVCNYAVEHGCENPSITRGRNIIGEPYFEESLEIPDKNAEVRFQHHKDGKRFYSRYDSQYYVEILTDSLEVKHDLQEIVESVMGPEINRGKDTPSMTCV